MCIYIYYLCIHTCVYIYIEMTQAHIQKQWFWNRTYFSFNKVAWVEEAGLGNEWSSASYGYIIFWERDNLKATKNELRTADLHKNQSVTKFKWWWWKAFKRFGDWNCHCFPMTLETQDEFVLKSLLPAVRTLLLQWLGITVWLFGVEGSVFAYA